MKIYIVMWKGTPLLVSELEDEAIAYANHFSNNYGYKLIRKHQWGKQAVELYIATRTIGEPTL